MRLENGFLTFDEPLDLGAAKPSARLPPASSCGAGHNGSCRKPREVSSASTNPSEVRLVLLSHASGHLRRRELR